MSKPKKFEAACQEIKKRDSPRLPQYKLQGPNRDPAVLLKPTYRAIARKYLYYELTGRPHFSYRFALQQVTDACKLADIYVTDVVKKFY